MSETTTKGVDMKPGLGRVPTKEELRKEPKLWVRMNETERDAYNRDAQDERKKKLPAKKADKEMADMSALDQLVSSSKDYRDVVPWEGAPVIKVRTTFTGGLELKLTDIQKGLTEQQKAAEDGKEFDIEYIVEQTAYLLAELCKVEGGNPPWDDPKTWIKYHEAKGLWKLVEIMTLLVEPAKDRIAEAEKFR